MTIPYTPDFVEQVEAGNVTKISSTGETVSGEFEKAYKPKGPGRRGRQELRDRDSDLRQQRGAVGLSEENDVTVEAEPINQGRGFLLNLILGFGPVILLVALFVWLSRRAAGGQMSALGAFGRSRARRVEGEQTR